MVTSTHTLYGLRESRPGPVWRQLFDLTWPAYRNWYLREGEAARPTAAVAARAVSRHLPELLPVWARLAEVAGLDELAVRMLSMWNLPAFAPAGCSQVYVSAGEPTLVRNYDYRPDLFEWVSMSSDHLQPVIGTSDCLWGLLDGVNADGLMASLTFGGDRAVGPGFGIPIVVRYVLETCSTVAQAKRALARVPVSMSYNVTVADRAGRVVTAYVSPGREAEFASQRLATNHRWQAPLDPAHAAKYRSIERYDALDSMITAGADGRAVARRLLEPPLFSRDYSGGFGTLYTASYRADSPQLTYLWPGLSWTRGFEDGAASVQVALSGT